MQIAGPFRITIGAYPATDGSLDTDLLSGEIAAVLVNLTGTGGDLAITTKGDSQTPSQSILAVTVSGDASYLPRAQTVGITGSNLTGVYEEIAIHDKVHIAVTGAAAADVFDVTLLLED